MQKCFEENLSNLLSVCKTLSDPIHLHMIQPYKSIFCNEMYIEFIGYFLSWFFSTNFTSIFCYFNTIYDLCPNEVFFCYENRFFLFDLTGLWNFHSLLDRQNQLSQQQNQQKQYPNIPIKYNKEGKWHQSIVEHTLQK